VFNSDTPVVAETTAPLNAPLGAPLNAPLPVSLDAPLDAPLSAPLNAPPTPTTDLPQAETPNNIVSDTASTRNFFMNQPINFPTLNTTYFLKQQESDDDDSEITSDTPSAIIFEVEQKMRDSVKAIQFKEMLLARDKHSREVILQRCIEWLQMPTTRNNSKTLDWFMALSLLKTKDLMENSYLWHTLHDSIYASESFKTVVSFFENF
jgi:hypothetical protein